MEFPCPLRQLIQHLRRDKATPANIMEHSPSIQTYSSSASQKKNPSPYSKQPIKFEALDNIMENSDFTVRGI
jgi:hypothetical protein